MLILNHFPLSFVEWKDFENADVGCAQAVPGRNNLPMCNGGVVAINGKTGSTLWRQQVSNAVLDVQCRLEINGDGIADCVLSGKGVSKFCIIFL